ncbi:hypothetical protein KIN20_024259 [Parelaphostrongylus tenuis]|uniref:Uncharacterized protein n=1 Tax=Parelaphostrongylus tenuis TaxID=148309 RepID=A0AAD5QW75_PARTN|nr:hypothetical protein KIN20_024259 [Parelaphostrongylus tenuis]
MDPVKESSENQKANDLFDKVDILLNEGHYRNAYALLKYDSPESRHMEKSMEYVDVEKRME